MRNTIHCIDSSFRGLLTALQFMLSFGPLIKSSTQTNDFYPKSQKRSYIIIKQYQIKDDTRNPSNHINPRNPLI